MKTLVIPDLHEPSQAVLDGIEKTIAAERPDKTVFLGDYFDQFDDTPDDARRTAEWLKHSLAEPNRVHLVGNHDAAYFWPSPATACPGFTPGKLAAIEAVLGTGTERSRPTIIDIQQSGSNCRRWAERFVFHAWVDGWLVSHAGLGSCWLPSKTDSAEVAEWLAAEERTARTAFESGQAHWFSAIGQRRGGHSPSGGLLWCDFRELEIFHITGLCQLVGHTPGRVPRWHGKTNLCIDTNLGRGPQHFAVVADGKIEIRPLQS